MSSNYMSYEEFEFFNSQFSLISLENYKELRAKQKKNEISYFCDETLNEKQMFLLFGDYGINYISFNYISFNSLNFDYKLINNVTYYDTGLFFTYDVSEDKQGLYRYIINNFSNGQSDYDAKCNGEIFNSEEEFKKYIAETFTNNSINHGYNNEVLDFFGFTNERRVRITGEDRNYEVKIVKDVIEIRKDNINYRLVLFENFYNERGSLEIESYAEDNTLYNYMDKDRIFVEAHKRSNNSFFVIAMETNNYVDEELVINKKLMGVIGRNASKTIGNNSNFIPPQIFNFFKDRMTFYYENDNKKVDSKQEKVFKKYIELLEAGKTIKINNILMNKNMIKFTEENFCIMFDETFICPVNHFHKLYKMLKAPDVRYNFNTFYEKLLTMSRLRNIQPHRDHSVEKCEFIVNDMVISLTKRTNRYYINDVFVRIFDVLHILTNVLCYSTREDYNTYIKNVSFIGIKFVKLINTGINIEFDYSAKIFDGVMPMMRLSLLWDPDKKRNIYLYMNKLKYRISDKRKFLKYFDGHKIFTGINTLKKYFKNCLEDFNPENYYEVLFAAIEEGKIVKQRGEELVKQSIADIKAELTTELINNIEINGYKLKGAITQAYYFIRTDNLDVYKFTNGAWNKRCVIDRSDKNRIYEDRLANRIVNIYNEPEYIHTIG